MIFRPTKKQVLALLRHKRVEIKTIAALYIRCVILSETVVFGRSSWVCADTSSFTQISGTTFPNSFMTMTVFTVFWYLISSSVSFCDCVL